jgi:glycosyltransferase 2 family protein
MAVNGVVKQEKHKRSKWLWRVVNMVIAIALVAYMLSQVEWATFIALLQQLSPAWLIAAFIAYFLQNVFRSYRYITLLDRDDVPVLSILPIALYHNFLVRVLPFKLGEFSYIVLTRNRLNVPMQEGVSSLIGSRLLELLMMVAVVAISLPFAGNLLANQDTLAIVLSIGSVIAVIIGFYYTGTILRGIVVVLRRILHTNKATLFILKLESFAAEFDRICQPRIFIRALIWSCLSYASSFVTIAIMLYAVGLRVDAVTTVILISIGMFATGIPFNVGGFGAVELGWAFGLTTFATYEMGEATSIGLMINGFQVLSAALLGLIGYGILQWHENRKG